MGDLVWKGIRGVAGLTGAVIVGLALAAPALRRPDGSLLPLAWTATLGGLCLVLLAASWRTRWQRCGWLLALAVAGQACALALIHAPNYNLLYSLYSNCHHLCFRHPFYHRT